MPLGFKVCLYSVDRFSVADIRNLTIAPFPLNGLLFQYASNRCDVELNTHAISWLLLATCRCYSRQAFSEQPGTRRLPLQTLSLSIVASDWLSVAGLRHISPRSASAFFDIRLRSGLRFAVSSGVCVKTESGLIGVGDNFQGLWYTDLMNSFQY